MDFLALNITYLLNNVDFLQKSIEAWALFGMQQKQQQQQCIFTSRIFSYGTDFPKESKLLKIKVRVTRNNHKG